MDSELLRNLAVAHTALGLAVVAVFLILRRDRMIRLYGESIAGLALMSIVGLALAVLVDEDSTFYDEPWSGVVVAPVFIALLLALRVGADEEPPAQRRMILGLGVLFLVITSVVGLVWPGDDGALGVAPLMLSIGVAVASLMALHIVLDHSTGPGYKIVFETSMATIILASVARGVLSLVAGTDIAASSYDDELGLRPVFWLTLGLQTIAVLVLWISTVVHENKEIKREHQTA